jgi:hypothetical protein
LASLTPLAASGRAIPNPPLHSLDHLANPRYFFFPDYRSITAQGLYGRIHFMQPVIEIILQAHGRFRVPSAPLLGKLLLPPRQLLHHRQQSFHGGKQATQFLVVTIGSFPGLIGP